MNHKKNTSIDIEKLSYAPKLAEQLFEPIQHLPWTMLLRSSAKSHQDSRFDVLVAKPLVTLTTFAGQTTIETPQQCTVSGDDPFVLTAQYQAEYLADLECDLDVPFVGGALGYWAYDLGRRIEKLPVTAEHDIPMPDMAVGLYEWAVIVDHHTQSAFVLGRNVSAAWSWLQAQKPPPLAPFSVGTWQSNMTKQQYSEKFAAVQDYLLSGDCYQVNLTQRFCAPYQGNEWHIYSQLEAVNSAPFSAFIRLEQGAIISLSPERFLQVNDRNIDTKPIKGTRPRSSDAQQDQALAAELAKSAKDQAENLMIVDLLRNDVGKVAKPGSARVPHLFAVESFPAVHHLVSTITAQLDDDYTMAQLLRACFPGGSITGAPKVRAMQVIEELEPHRRSLYCGSIGYISRHGRMDTSITIRTLIACQHLLYVWAGGGLVADSQVDDEYQETLDKLSRILPLLG
ncbi:MAG: aminodeoxychorismate synthase component I [Vibrio sp.]